MHPAIANKRLALAQVKSDAAVEQLADRFNIDTSAFTARHGNDPEVKRVFQSEAMADFLTTVADTAIGIVQPQGAAEDDEQAVTLREILTAEQYATLAGVDGVVTAFVDPGLVARLTDDELEALPGYGKATIKKLREHVGYAQPHDDDVESPETNVTPDETGASGADEQQIESAGDGAPADTEGAGTTGEVAS